MNVYKAMKMMGISDLQFFIYYHKEFKGGYKAILKFLESEYEPENENPVRPAEGKNEAR